MNDRRQHFLTGKPTECHVLTDLSSNGGKRLGKGHDMFVLGALTDVAESRMRAVLLAPLGVATGCLDVPIRKRADPDVRPGRRDRKRFNPTNDIRVGDTRAVRTGVAEAFS